MNQKFDIPYRLIALFIAFSILPALLLSPKNCSVTIQQESLRIIRKNAPADLIRSSSALSVWFLLTLSFQEISAEKEIRIPITNKNNE
ncbi:MAG: hypothetical protein IJY29_07450 [Ruminococcus sp.]|nr:hypothetical protein [Ruminococcus sp.]